MVASGGLVAPLHRRLGGCPGDRDLWRHVAGNLRACGGRVGCNWFADDQDAAYVSDSAGNEMRTWMLLLLVLLLMMIMVMVMVTMAMRLTTTGPKKFLALPRVAWGTADCSMVQYSSNKTTLKQT